MDFNRRRNLPSSGTGASPAVNFKLGDLVLVRDVGGVNRLKPGEKAGSTKLRGAVKGPFRYRAQTSPRHCEVEDADGNVWDKAYDDVIPFDSARPFNTCKVKDSRCQLAWLWQMNKPSEALPANGSYSQRRELALQSVPSEEQS